MLSRHAVSLLRAQRRSWGLRPHQASSMKLSSASTGRKGMTEAMYNWRVAAVYNALKEKGKESGPLAVEDLTALGHLDQYHYLGVEANDHVIEILGLDSESSVLDIGSGIGGPARYIASKSGCKILGVELQEDICTAATDLTNRMPELAGKVDFKVGSFTSLAQSGQIPPESFDHFMSLLVFLHIPDRTSLLKACYDSLRPGATFLIEDFAAKPGANFTDKEKSSLLNVVSAPTVSTIKQYIEDLEAAGFVDVEAVDLTPIWQKWTKARHDLYQESREETVKTQGQEIFDSRVKFYKIIEELFAGNLGGVRITGRKASKCEAKLIKGRRTNFSVEGSAVHVVEGKTRNRAVAE